MKKTALLLVLLLPACAVTTTGKIRDCTEDYIGLGALGYEPLEEIHSVCMQVYRPGTAGPRQPRTVNPKAHSTEKREDNIQARR